MLRMVEAVLLQHVLEVPLAEDDDVIEALAPDAAEESALANGIHERSSDCRPKNADGSALCGTVEVGTELPVVVADDELAPEAEWRGFAHLQCRPLRGWVSRERRDARRAWC